MFVTLAMLFALPAQAETPPRFVEEGPLASDSGYFMVEWESEGPVTLEIERDGALQRERTLYSGQNTALFVSGLIDGTYELRLRGADGEVAQVLALKVEHQPLDRALWLVALGALAFLATVAVIVRGARDE